MGLAQDLLQQAIHLATYQGTNPTQAALRRAVSTAYYALFHLLIEDASQRWNGSTAAVTGLERAFNHGTMKDTSARFSSSRWQDWHGTFQILPLPLQRVALTFIALQEDRQAADYDNHDEWTVTDVEAVLNTTQAAFHDWLSIRTDPMAGNYLLSMLLGKPRQ